MISSNEIQSAYIDLYVQFRKYIWPFRVVNLVVDLEIETFKLFPDLASLYKIFQELNREISSTSKDDQDFQSAIDAYEKLISRDCQLYAAIDFVREVISDENN